MMYSDTGGTGPVVVLLHGVLMSGSVWKDVVGGLLSAMVRQLELDSHDFR